MPWPRSMRNPTSIWPSVLFTMLLLLVVFSLSRPALAGAKYTSGHLTLKLTLEMATCDLLLMSPSSLDFPSLSSSDLSGEAGHVSVAGQQYISIVTQNCPDTGKDGARPALQVIGETTSTVNDRIFRDYSSTANGNIGFGLRYVNAITGLPDQTIGKDGGYLTNGDFINLADVGKSPRDGIETKFLVDMIHKPIGDTISSGILKGTLRFQLIYH